MKPASLTHIEALSARQARVWMGIVNVTPDSFSDGGQWFSPENAVARAHELVAAGAHILDLGGLSTRPGSEAISPEAELARVAPVLRTLRQSLPSSVLLSLDSYRGSVAAPLGEAGLIDIVNDVMAGLNPEEGESTIAVAARLGLGFVAMHMQGSPKSMQENPTYADCVGEVSAFLATRAQAARDAGVGWVSIDPGLGFGKSFAHNQALLGPEALERLSMLGYPLLIGLSRKRFLTQWFPEDNLAVPASRDARTKELEEHCFRHGAKIIRSHRMPTEVRP